MSYVIAAYALMLGGARSSTGSGSPRRRARDAAQDPRPRQDRIAVDNARALGSINHALVTGHAVRLFQALGAA